MAETTFVTVKSNRKEIERETKEQMQNRLNKVGAIVEGQAKRNVNKAPPEHPQVKTGRLINSIMHEMEEGAVLIGSNVEYSKSLEFGSTRHPAYPWLFPAVEEKRNEIIKTLRGDIIVSSD